MYICIYGKDFFLGGISFFLKEKERSKGIFGQGFKRNPRV